jgi:hypothetical protein
MYPLRTETDHIPADISIQGRDEVTVDLSLLRSAVC